MGILAKAISLFRFPVAAGCRVYNLRGSAAALLLALREDPFVAVEKDGAAARTLLKDILFFRSIFQGGDVVLLPDPDGAGESGSRAELMHRLARATSVVASSLSLASGLWEKRELEKSAFLLRIGDSVDRSSFETSLVRLGYRKAPMVSERGEYSRREWIFDVFPSAASDAPLRIELFGDEIERMVTFDVGSQRADSELREFFLYPAAEPDSGRPLSESMGGRQFCLLYPVGSAEGLPENTAFLSKYSFESSVGASDEEGAPWITSSRDALTLPLEGNGILPGERKRLDELPAGVRRLSENHRVVLVASSPGQAERLRDIFADSDMIVPLVTNRELESFEGDVALTVGELSAGVFLDGLAMLTEREIFGPRPSHRPLKKSKVANLLKSLDDIAPGDYVVHRDHGIGRFMGVVRQKSEDAELELLLIDYEGGRVYVPIQNISILSKFRYEEGAEPRLDSLGGKTWQRKKERARRKIHEMAARLLSLYATRKTTRGFTFSQDTELHREFESFFSYVETPDQLKAIQDIKRDMESDRPMDRLLCGDVGYGKTEVAMRAAFKAVYDSRQVAVLVPTTILAEQHYRTFRERFSGFPLAIDFLSRFKSPKELRETLGRVSKGETDIIIGTHAILSKKVSFARLGLLIIDEEHRFGVGQKERIKELSRDVDVLALTATPIPRTLYMALSGIRDISVIETPPEERLAVKSVVTVFSEGGIRDAIRAELQRSGQVFFVHNRIADISRMAELIGRLVPEAGIGIAHGQMAEKELEGVMHRFFEAETNVLVSTAIIGSGLDVPRANTIIINRADRMGLADLYQLRGRVGRSNVKGYAYFVAPPESQLTEEARLRLQAVQEMSYLGAGFRLALKDLEIRGAGELFGAEQSGRIHEIGFDLYIEMLEKAVAELKGVEVKEEAEPEIEIRVSGFIPDGYVEDIGLRLSLYRRIAGLRTLREIGDFESELRDRFGQLPEEAVNLLRVVTLKALARPFAVTRVSEREGKVIVRFAPSTPVEPGHLFSLQKGREGKIRFLPDGLELDLRGAGWGKVFDELGRLMADLGETVQIGE